MSAVVRAQGLGKRYGRRWALAECTVEIPAGRVVGLVGPNGAGKTTLLRLAVGQLRPTTGTIRVLGEPPDDPSGELRQDGCLARLAAEGDRQVVTYHPAQRFWRFQAYETVIFGLLSLLLLGFCFRGIRPD